MHNTLRAIVICLLTTASLAIAQEPVAVNLRTGAEVGAGVIRLADVAHLPEDCPEELARVVLGNAPWPGHRRAISNALVHMRMLASGVPARRYELGGAEVCVVQRRSLRISSERLASVARGRLEKLTGAADGQVGVELVRAPRDLHLAEEGPEPELRASLVGDGAPTGRVRVNVDVVRGDERLERATAVFDVKVWQSVATARRRIAAGEPLGEHNVAFVRRETARSGSSLITSADDLQGRVAGRPVPAGGLVDRAVLAAPDRPVVVRRNQRVRLVARIGNLRAMALGKAGSPARPGEVVKVVNLATGREVAGVAQTDGSVHVLLGDDQ